MQSVKHLKVFKTASPFDRRITSLVWHPKSLTTLAVGSKGGDIILWNHQHESHDVFIQGLGAGGSIQAMKFDYNEDNHLYTCSIDGTFCRRNLRSNQVTVYLNTGEDCYNNWYTSFDVSFTGGLLLAGDNKGYVNLLTKDGTPIWKQRLHKSKVHHIEFHSGTPWLFATSSGDNFVRLWDVRNIKNTESALVELKHEKGGVNSAYFSPAHGTRLLITDQHSELKIFSGPLWNLETKILHPHRHFQHISPIKADWHPLEDIVVVGRYPDPKFTGSQGMDTFNPGSEPRTVDFFDASDGELICQLEPVGQKGIMCLNRFDQLGNILASAHGAHILLWAPKYSETNIPSTSDICQSVQAPMRRPLTMDNDNDLKKKKRNTSARKQK
ncbi:DNA damage-binding protein 2-like isoform X2 [Daphnia pulicaria]|nr:DNA damage-binding protein 2-like isoform X2 [Daphnia pulicaria]